MLSRTVVAAFRQWWKAGWELIAILPPGGPCSYASLSDAIRVIRLSSIVLRLRRMAEDQILGLMAFLLAPPAAAISPSHALRDISQSSLIVRVRTDRDSALISSAADV
jgi:hypothetical protein